jgi:hypothetical protein
VPPDDGVLHRNMSELFNVNFNANLKLFLRLSNCASVGEKTLIGRGLFTLNHFFTKAGLSTSSVYQQGVSLVIQVR